MTMTAHAAIPAPPDPVAYHDPHHPTYGFHTSEWHEMPRPEGDDWFPSEERYRREANAHAYRQHGSPQNWFRYLTLGFFVYDDCSKFDALWMKYSSDPIICHRMVWYNFMHHVDRKFEISNTLSAWATDVSQPYLQRHAPQFLSLNTLESTWSDYIRGDHDVMDIDVTNWTTVGSRKKGARSVSPPPVRNEDVSYQNRNITHPTEKSDDATTTLKSLGGKSDISTVPKDNHTGTSTQTIASETSSTIGKQSALQPTLNVPTNDGTYRLTFRWNPKGNFNDYNETSPLWLKDVHSMMSDLFSDDTCRLFRWESTDLQTSSAMSDLSPGKLREFISPKITFLTSTSQVIFGARVCFASSFPNQWKNNERTLQLMKDYQVQVSISNSSTNSGKIVTAGYILFKAARTTHRNRFLQSLRQRLPKATPFFDILLFHRTPMEQKINHLVVQCGENHVSPLSQALSALLTGCNSPLYLSRLALANLQPSQISRYFEMQDIYSKSLKSFPLFPTLSNLDRIRNEFFEDGTVMERSTRDWASTIFSDKTDAGARCEVVNGGFDQKAYILVPPPYASIVQEQLRQYRLRINPIGRREARFRDSLPGLPTVIHIDHSTQHNLDRLASMSAMDYWKSAPPSVRGTASDESSATRTQHIQFENGLSNPRNPPSATRGSATADHHQADDSRRLSRRHGRSDATSLSHHSRKSKGGHKSSTMPPSGGTSHTAPDSDVDDVTAGTQSATQSLITPSMLSSVTSKRLQELEAMFRQQQQDSIDNAKANEQTAHKLQHIETKLGRIDDMDALLHPTIANLHDNSVKQVLTMERQQDSHVQIVELNLRMSRLTDVIDRMASRIEVLSTALFSDPSVNSTPNAPRDRDSPTLDHTRRRSLDEMKASTPNPVDRQVGPVTAKLGKTHGQQSDQDQVDETQFTHPSAMSPSKKKSKPLYTALEDMSLGSVETHQEDLDSGHVPSSGCSKESKSDELLLDDESLDDLSSEMPDLDTQYTNQRDPEGGASE